jgi:pimeloyl-ACP methyl ester carboxylesterase
VIHGEQDDFAPIAVAKLFAAEALVGRPARFEAVPGANHFLNDGPTEVLLRTLEASIPRSMPAANGILAAAWDRIKSAVQPHFSPAGALQPDG